MLLIDADIIAYRAAASAENENIDIAISRTDSMMMELLSFDNKYLSFLSGENNFRKVINPEYKANRKDIIKPIYLNDCKQYLIDEFKSIVTDGYEADDALGFNQTEETVICSIDKDLMMIPGMHYNFVKKEYHEVSELDGIKQFYRQMLIGDSVDNIMGIKGIGKVKAAKLIDPLENEEEMYNLVANLYFMPNEPIISRFNINADCLWIWRKEGERFSHRYENNQKNCS
jgi:5'-3' exonuclease